MEEKGGGEFVGAFPSYGYIKKPGDNHKLIVDEEAAQIVRKIFEWKVKDGLGNLTICHKLNNMGILNPTGYKKKKLKQNYNNSQISQEDYSWGPSTVRNILKNDIYIGNVTQGKRRVKSYKVHKVEQVPEEEWITVENMHEPIIDKELFKKAQELRKIDTRVQSSGNLSMWAGILKCADCKRAMHKRYCTNKSGKSYEYYICSTYKKKSNKLCTKHTIKLEDLESAVLTTVKQHIELMANIEEIVQQTKDNLRMPKSESIENIKEEKEKEIKKLNDLKRCLYEDWKNSYITKEEYLEYKRKYEQDINKKNQIIVNLNNNKLEDEECVNNNNMWIENFKVHKNIDKLDRDIITELIDCIEIHEDKRITVYFKFQKVIQ